MSSGRIFLLLNGHSLPLAFILIGGMTKIENVVNHCSSNFLNVA